MTSPFYNPDFAEIVDLGETMTEPLPESWVKLPEPDALIKRMESPDFWEAFFSAFLLTVHPAEFAVRVPERGNGQKEEALSAAFQRTFLQFRSALGLEHWVPVLEAPVVNQKGEYCWCDITFTPWVSELEDESWKAAKNSEQHVRIEVKWHEGKPREQGITTRASLNESRQHFVIALNFSRGDFQVPFSVGTKTECEGSRRCVYAKIRPRLGAEFKHYTHFSLIVFQMPISTTTVTVLP